MASSCFKDILPSTRRAVQNTRDSVEELRAEIAQLREQIANLGEQIDCLNRHVDASDRQSLFQRVVQADESINRHLAYKADAIQKAASAYESKAEMLLWELYREPKEEAQDARKRFFCSLPKATGSLRLLQLGCAQLLKEFDALCHEHDIPYWIAFGTLLGAVRHGGFIPWDDDTDLGMMREDIDRLKELVRDDPRYQITTVFDPWNFCKQVRFKFADNAIPCFLDLFVFDKAVSADHELFERQQTFRNQMIDELRHAVWYETWLNGGHAPEGSEMGRRVAQCMAAYRNKTLQSHILDADGPALIWGIDNITDLNGYDWICSNDAVFTVQRIEFEEVECCAPAHLGKFLREVYGDIYQLPNDIASHIGHVERKDLDGQVFHDAIKSIIASE